MHRPLTEKEHELLRWLLENGNAAALQHVSSIKDVRVISECPCGCASIDFSVAGAVPNPHAGMEIVSDWLWTSDRMGENGVFVFLNDGLLAGLEVWSADGQEIPGLPRIDQLRPWSGST